MKLFLVKFLMLIFLLPINGSSQQKHSDEDLRKIAMVKYLEPLYLVYETALGEATANIILFNFKGNLNVPDVDLKNLSSNDQSIILALQYALKKLKQGIAPTWEDIIILETNWLIEQDKAVNRSSKYKASSNDK